MEKTKACITFSLCAESLEHEKISKMLNLNPNHMRYNSEILNNRRAFGHDEWGIETGYEETTDIQVQFMKIMSLLSDKRQTITEICSEFSAECCFLVTILVHNGEFPAMGIDTNSMKFAFEINAEIVFDLYYLV